MDADLTSQRPFWNENSFGDIDGSGDTGYFVKFLKYAKSTDSLQQARKVHFEMLSLRPKEKVLDAGCGEGFDARLIAKLVGPQGYVAGIDLSALLIEEAVAQLESRVTNVEFFHGDVYRLPFRNEAFDVCRAERLFWVLDEPDRALAELVRVTRPGGRIVVTDYDFETLIVDYPDFHFTRKLLNYASDRRGVGGRIGRSLPRLFSASGLKNVRARPFATKIEYPLALEFFGENLARAVFKDGIATHQELELWLSYLANAEKDGSFFACLTGFVVAGEREVDQPRPSEYSTA